MVCGNTSFWRAFLMTKLSICSQLIIRQLRGVRRFMRLDFYYIVCTLLKTNAILLNWLKLIDAWNTNNGYEF